jgi:anti-anti-sigma regulatory factor
MRPDGDFMIEIRANRIVVAGDIDQVSVDDLERAIRALPGHGIDVDLGAVDHISWPGLRVLLDARVLHPQLRVVAVSEQVDHVLASSRTAEYLRGPSDRDTKDTWEGWNPCVASGFDS